MWERFRRFLDNNQELLKERYVQKMLPTLAGAIMYFAKERKSYSERPQLDFAERKNMGDVRMISIFRHNDFYDYVYVQEEITKDTPSSIFLSLFQFDFSSPDFPSELPITWDSYLTQWLVEKFNFVWLLENIEELWSLHEGEPFFDHLCNTLNQHGSIMTLENSCSSLHLSNILEMLYREESDDGYIYLLIDSLHRDLLEKISSLALKDLHEHYEWYFWRFKADIRKASMPTSSATPPP